MAIVRGLLTAAAVLAGTLGGAAAGGVVARLFSTGMGWDRLADVLGGLMVGAAVGLATSAWAVWAWHRRRRAKAPGAAPDARA